eukprot:618587_1
MLDLKRFSNMSLDAAFPRVVRVVILFISIHFVGLLLYFRNGVIFNNIHFQQSQTNTTNATSYLTYPTIEFTSKLYNSISNKWIKCEPHKHKYIQLLLQQLNQTPRRNYVNSYEINKWTQKHLSYEMNKWAFRLKFDGHALYLHKGTALHSPGEYYLHFYHYYASFFSKYTKYIMRVQPNFNIDFLTWFWDSKSITFDLNTMPVFMAEGNATAQYLQYNSLLLLSISRSLVELYQSAVPQKPNNSNYSSKENEHVRKVKSTMNLTLPTNSWDWKSRSVLYNEWDSKIMEFLFRGGGGKNVLRKELVARINNMHSNETSYNIQLKSRSRFISPRKESKRKFVVVIDGVGVRDMFTRSMLYNSVILKNKYLNGSVEFWYYDLVNNTNVIYWRTVDEFVDIAQNIIKQLKLNNVEVANHLRSIAYETRKFVFDYLNIESLDCFTMHMFEIYRHYFFQSNGTDIDSHDTMLYHNP